MQPTPSLYCSKTSLSPSFSPLSRVLSNNSVTVTTVSKHQFHLVLQCGVNNTECTAHTQSFNRDGGTSNSTAAATFIRKSQDVSLSTPLFRPLLSPHTKHSAHLFRVLVFCLVTCHSRDHICTQNGTCRHGLDTSQFHTLTSSSVFLQVKGAIMGNRAKFFSNIWK